MNEENNYIIMDIRFIERVEQAWQDHNAGKFIRTTKDDFLKKLRAC